MRTNAIAEYYQELKRNTSDPTRLEKINREEQENQKAYNFYVEEEIKRGETPIRFAVYGSSRKFIGYKSDSFWTLHEAFAKIHPLDDKDIDKLLKSFVWCRNQFLFLFNNHISIWAQIQTFIDMYPHNYFRLTKKYNFIKNILK